MVTQTLANVQTTPPNTTNSHPNLGTDWFCEVTLVQNPPKVLVSRKYANLERKFDLNPFEATMMMSPPPVGNDMVGTQFQCDQTNYRI